LKSCDVTCQKVATAKVARGVLFLLIIVVASFSPVIFGLQSSVFIPSSGYISYGLSGEFFRDGFESGDLSAWTSIYKTTGDNVSVVSSNPYEGKFHARFQTDGAVSGVEWSVCYYDVSVNISEVYTRGYFFVASGMQLDDNDDRFALVTIYDPTSSSVQAIFRVINVGGVRKFQLNMASGSNYFAAVTDAVYPQEGVWYCIELYFKVHSTQGEGRVWINGVEQITVTGKDTDNYGNIKQIRYGLVSVNVQHPVDVYCDSVVASTEYIGPLSKYSFAVIGNPAQVANVKNIYWMLGNLSISYKQLLPSEVTNQSVLNDVDGVISFVNSAGYTLFNASAVRMFAEYHVVISDVYDFCYLYYPELMSSCSEVSGVSTVTYLMDWGNLRTGDRPELRHTDGKLRVVSSSALNIANVTKIAQLNSAQVALFHMNGQKANSGYYVMDLQATRDSSLRANNWHLFPVLSRVSQISIGKYARWLADGLSWYSLDWVNNFVNNLATQNPSFVQIQSIGTSVEGRNITAIFIGKGSRYILVDGAMHGNEKTGTAGCLRLAELLVQFYKSGESYWQQRLTDYTVIIVPVSNPDGYFNNSRGNANGVDLNRNYPPEGSMNQPESQAFASLLGNYTPTIFVNFHTQIFQVLFFQDSSSILPLPYGYFSLMLWSLSNRTYVSLKHWGFNAEGKPYGEIDKIDQSSINGPVYEYAWWKHKIISCLLEFVDFNPAYNLLGQEYYLSVVFSAIQNYDRNQDFLAYSNAKILNTSVTTDLYEIGFEKQDLKEQFVLDVYVCTRGKPVSVFIDGVKKEEGDGWVWSPIWQLKDTVQVTEASSNVRLEW